MISIWDIEGQSWESGLGVSDIASDPISPNDPPPPPPLPPLPPQNPRLSKEYIIRPVLRKNGSKGGGRSFWNGGAKLVKVIFHRANGLKFAHFLTPQNPDFWPFSTPIFDRFLTLFDPPLKPLKWPQNWVGFGRAILCERRVFGMSWQCQCYVSHGATCLTMLLPHRHDSLLLSNIRTVWRSSQFSKDLAPEMGLRAIGTEIYSLYE